MTLNAPDDAWVRTIIQELTNIRRKNKKLRFQYLLDIFLYPSTD